MSDLRERPPSLAQLLDPAVQADPHILYRRMRARGSVIWDPYVHTWIVTGYPEAVTVFQDFLAARTPSAETFARMGLPMLGPAAGVLSRQMMFMDPPRHMAVRAACSALFTPGRIKRLEDHMRAICRDLLRNIEPGSTWDLHAAYAEPLPAMIITDIVGLPAQDWRRLQIWADDFAALIGNFHQSAPEGRRLAASLDALTAYIRRAIAEQRAGARHGLIGALIDRAPPDHPPPEPSMRASSGDGFDDDDIIANVIITMVGGLGTITNLISSGVATLTAHPDAMRHMRDSRAVLPAAVEEILRYETPSQFSGRICPADTQLGGQRIAKGDAVMVMTAAANRDPVAFPQPDAFDIFRSPNRHLAFAWGPHFCFGATLARIEASVAFDELLVRVSDIALAEPTLYWRNNLGLRGLTRLMVTTPMAPPP